MSKVFVVLQIEVDSAYYEKEEHDPSAIVEICTIPRVFAKKEDAYKYKKDNSGLGISFEVYEMTVREGSDND